MKIKVVSVIVVMAITLIVGAGIANAGGDKAFICHISE